jgi:hypothetical protein
MVAAEITRLEESPRDRRRRKNERPA